jgi:hypothetical protein
MPVEHAPIEKIPFPESADAKRQSVEVPGTRKPGQTGIILLMLSQPQSYTYFLRSLSKW